MYEDELKKALEYLKGNTITGHSIAIDILESILMEIRIRENITKGENVKEVR